MANMRTHGAIAYLPNSAGDTSDLAERVRAYGVMLTLVQAAHGVVLEGISRRIYRGKDGLS